MVNIGKEIGKFVERVPDVGVSMTLSTPPLKGKSLQLVVHGLEQAGPSYDVRVFIDNKSADMNTPLDLQHGFVGTIPIYGYGPSSPVFPKVMSRKAKSPMSRELTLPEELEKMISGKDVVLLTLIPVRFGKAISAENVFTVENAELRVKTKNNSRTSGDDNGK